MKIGFFDSGVGGLTVLNEALKKINCDYIYLADNLNAPYGIKEKEQVKKYIEICIEELVKRECSIIVIACNTATSIAIKDLRKKYPNIVFIGTEPAIKVAADEKHDKILICATTLTILGEKLEDLIIKLHIEDKVDLLPADKLVLFAENGNVKKSVVEEYLKQILGNRNIKMYSHIVLGCTHFPLFRENFRNIFGENTKIIDGSVGITNNLIRQLKLKEFIFNQKNSNIELVISKNDQSFIDNVKRILNRKDIKVTLMNK